MAWCLVFVCLFGVQRSAAVQRKGAELRIHSGPFRLWGLDISGAALSDATTEQAIGALISWAQYGISGVALSFQPRGSECGAFAADGSIADRALVKRIQNLSQATIDRWMVPVIEVFSSDQSAALESSAACEQALTEVARTFEGNSDVIINIGCVARGMDPAKCVRILREEGYRGLVGADVDESASIPVDILFLTGKPGEPIPPVNVEKPVVITAVVENPKQRGKPRPGLDEYVRAVAQQRGISLIGRIPSCCEGPSTRFNLGGQNAPSDMSVAWYLRKISEAQLSLHGPIDESATAPAGEIALLDPGEKEDGFVPLFDGRTLRGWTTLSDSWQSFSVESGVIACDGSSPNSYLRTVRRYSDFVLRLDAKIGPGGNSGIFIRAPLWGRSSRIGFELQIEGKPSPRPTRDSAGAIYDVLAPKVDAMLPPGEWNSYEITCRGPHVRILVNNQLVQDFSMDDVPALKDRLREGVIGLQDHSDKVWFRKIRMKELH
jgi:hypothetical protein